jgi:manganese/iron transport system permease protein/iron/zinc/copper transport system permease protein
VNWLTEPWQYEFMRHGIFAATMVGGLCGMIGVYVVLRRMSYIGHGMSHAVFGGAVIGYVLGWNFYLIAGAWGFVSALLINQVTRRRQIGADAAIGIVTTASFAFGVALISRAKHFTRNFDAALFGNLLGISNQDLLLIAATCAVMALLVFLFYKQLLFLTFDPEVAPVYGVPSQWVDTVFALMLAATIIVSIQIMGVTLIAASLVIPPVIARLLTASFARILVLSTLIGAATGFFGIYFSYYYDVASGATIVLLSATLFTVALLGSLVRPYLPQRFGSRPPKRAVSPIPALPQDIDLH